ncbi:hypothetical protein [Chitinophaga sp. LS1]|uniref:hypothetical protein n=1 Tax=Chitinophaga sp. LS1 TaxID=3051176 RepID=UPI002AAB26F0|nr:hypothetical protein [Chitinophaga sp. LS1]WPV67567.1 hypothetical protein QQL36_02365 [Chitinophaga sp. LS1]
MLIKLKPVYLNMLFKIIVSIGLLFAIGLFVFLPVDLVTSYSITAILVLGGIIYSFYLNRNEVLIIKSDAEKIEFSFVNNSIFKRKEVKLTISEIAAVRKGEFLALSNHEHLFAVVRKKAITTTEWDELLVLLKVY